MKKVFLLIVAAAILLNLTSCGSFGDAEKVAEDFYAKVQSKSYSDIIPLLSKEATESSPADLWVKTLEAKEQFYGPVKSFEKTYSGFTTSGDLSLIELKYKVENEKGTTYELFYMIEQDGEQMIYFYQYNKDEAALDGNPTVTEPPSQYASQIATCEQFYNILRSRKFNEIQSVISKEAIDATPVKDWIDYMVNKEKSAGPLKNFEKVSEEVKDLGDGNRIILKYKVEYEKSTLYEMFQFSEAVESTKIKFYQYDTTLDALK